MRITDFIFSYFPPNQTILKPKTLTNISRKSDIKKKEKKNNKRTEGYLRSDEWCRMKVEHLSYCVVSDGERWRRRMKERVREVWVKGNTWGHFWKGAGVLQWRTYLQENADWWILSPLFLPVLLSSSLFSSLRYQLLPLFRFSYFSFSSSQILPTARKTHYSRHLLVTLAFQLTNPPKRRSNAFQPTNPPKRRSNPSSKRVTCREYLLPSTNPISPFCQVSSSGTRRISSP